MMKLLAVSILLVSVVLHANGRRFPDVNVQDLPDVKLSPDDASKSLPPPEKKGVTFVKENHLVTFGIDLVGCRNWSDPNGMNCDPYLGDTYCSTLLPVLCAKVDDTPRPSYPIYGPDHAMPVWFYNGWNRGHISTTVPVKASQFVNHAAVDTFCAQSFGAGWRVAQFHDGSYIPQMNGTTYAGDSWTQNANQLQDGAWHFYSYGDVRNDIRFWIHIRDQPSACWAQ